MLRRGARTNPCGTPFLSHRNLLLLLFPVGGKGEAAIANHLHDHVNHVSMMQQLKQLAGEAAVPYSVVGCCEVDNTAPALFLAKNLSLMSCVSRVTWSTVHLPCRMSACS